LVGVLQVWVKCAKQTVSAVCLKIAELPAFGYQAISMLTGKSVQLIC
jgi:hypothetical protein